MIHVCRLDVGSRHVFDSADGINDVGSLVEAIEHHFNISKHKQILLISGGEVLDDYLQKLYRLSAGREESPIYLIDKVNVEKDYPPTIEMPLDNLTQDMKQEIEMAILLKPSFQTLQTRSQLAMRVYELGKNLHKLCQSFYDDQYWQYQGFLALIANLDEFFSSFRKRKDVINEQFEKYLSNRNYYKDLMKDIDKYIEILSNVRLLPQIISHTNQFSEGNAITQQCDCTKIINTPPHPSENLFSSFSSQSIADLQALQLNEHKLKLNSSSCLTLLEWIKSTDPQNKLNNVIEETREMLVNFDTNFKWDVVQVKINKLVDQIEKNPQMREIEGLTKRLQDLNNLLEMSKKFLAGQNEIVESFNANQERATKLKDESILQDLCLGHERQLELFKSNHTQMIEITRKISKAKLELIRVIHSRLNWVMLIQKQMADLDFQLQIYFKQLKRINVRLKLMDHIKKAPSVYLCSMKETIRRQKFSNVYKSFAESISVLASKVYKSEMQRRQSFESKISSSSQHFILNILFRSLSDKVEPLLNEITLKFDSQLPKLDEHEVLEIENELINQLSNLKSSFDSGTSSSSTSASSSSSACTPQLDTSSPMFESPQNSQSAASNLPTHNITKQATSEISATKLSKFSENFLAELNLDEFKFNLKDDFDLCLLDSLNRILLNDLQQPMSKLSASNNGNEQIADIRLKLNDTKQLLEDFACQFKSEFSLLIKKQVEIERAYAASVESSRAHEQAMKASFFSEFMTLLSNGVVSSDEAIALEFINAQKDETNKQFTKVILDHIEQIHSQHKKNADELKATINLTKKNLNADKQKQFNEAIKRATQEKDKIIEEQRLREVAYIEKINELQALLEERSTHQPVINETMQKGAIVNKSDVSNLNINNNDNKTQISSSIDDNSPIKLLPELTDNSNEPTQNQTENLETEDISITKMKLRELMLTEKITQLEKQLGLFTTLPVTNDYETIQLNSCNIDDLVIAVYNEAYGSYKIIHKSSNYLHFVHSAIFKSHEQRLSFKNPNASMRSSQQLATSPMSDSPLSGIEQSQIEFQFQNSNVNSNESTTVNLMASTSFLNNSSGNNSANYENNNSINEISCSLPHSPLVKNSPSDNVQNIFLAEKQPQWFIGRVLVKEFCIARKENNRFRVPSGTRFYRVKLKPYNL